MLPLPPTGRTMREAITAKSGAGVSVQFVECQIVQEKQVIVAGHIEAGDDRGGSDLHKDKATSWRHHGRRADHVAAQVERPQRRRAGQRATRIPSPVQPHSDTGMMWVAELALHIGTGKLIRIAARNVQHVGWRPCDRVGGHDRKLQSSSAKRGVQIDASIVILVADLRAGSKIVETNHCIGGMSSRCGYRAHRQDRAEQPREDCHIDPAAC